MRIECDYNNCYLIKINNRALIIMSRKYCSDPTLLRRVQCGVTMRGVTCATDYPDDIIPPTVDECRVP